MLTLRPYQQESVSACYAALRERTDNPCIVLPTGTGKSVVLAQIVSDAVTRWNGRVLVLAHVKELLQQNADKIERLTAGFDVGVYSAGLGSRDTDHKVIVAGIQSVYRRACELGKFDLIIVDEAHLIPFDGDGMYLQFLADAKTVNPAVRVIGLTATPFRMKGGLICQEDSILNHICYEAGLRQMINEGYLCHLISKCGVVKADLSNLHIRGGEFIASEVAAAMDVNIVTEQACAEIASLTETRNSVLMFASSVDHCQHIAETMQQYGAARYLTGKTPADERAEILQLFKDGAIKYLVNVNVLTTGFDATNIDCVVMLRPTASVGLYVQMVGRGTRLHPGKDNCLILDYGGNILRHGPVDSVTVDNSRNGHGQAPAKECPECHSVIHAAYQICPDCGHEFPLRPENSELRSQASDRSILKEWEYNDYDVLSVSYAVHTKRGASDDTPKTLRVRYEIGFNDDVSEWVCPEHTGWARLRFEKWWKERSELPPPPTAEVARLFACEGALKEPTAITVKSAENEFDRITRYEYGMPKEPVPDPEFEPLREWLTPEENALPLPVLPFNDEVPF